MNMIIIIFYFLFIYYYYYYYFRGGGGASRSCKVFISSKRKQHLNLSKQAPFLVPTVRIRRSVTYPWRDRWITTRTGSQCSTGGVYLHRKKLINITCQKKYWILLILFYRYSDARVVFCVLCLGWVRRGEESVVSVGFCRCVGEVTLENR